MSLPDKLADHSDHERLPAPKPASSCRLDFGAFGTPGEIRCPVCHQLVPPEHIGYKLHCRKCGYLESCCNPI